MIGPVLLVDDHPLFLEGLKYLLETHGINVAGVAYSAEEAFVCARSLRPDIILLDIRMPEVSGIEALRLIKAEMPYTKVVMLTTSDEDEDLLTAMNFGASGYLVKNTTAEILLDTLMTLDGGPPNCNGPHAPPSGGSPRGGAKRTSASDSGKVKKDRLFTARQKEILTLVAKGITYKEAGKELGLTERTVKYHMGRIIELLQLENRVQVIAYAARAGIIENQPESD